MREWLRTQLLVSVFDVANCLRLQRALIKISDDSPGQYEITGVEQAKERYGYTKGAAVRAAAETDARSKPRALLVNDFARINPKR